MGYGMNSKRRENYGVLIKHSMTRRHEICVTFGTIFQFSSYIFRRLQLYCLLYTELQRAWADNISWQYIISFTPLMHFISCYFTFSYLSITHMERKAVKILETCNLRNRYGGNKDKCFNKLNEILMLTLSSMGIY